jgi:methyltransferase (TIGR00027 family)
MRALAYKEVGAPIANDYLAPDFLSPPLRERIESAENRADILANEISITNYAYLTARTRHLDQLFQQALTDGTEQIVLLGAGYDSRSYRFLDVPDQLHIFEVDAPTTQDAKRSYLEKAAIVVPPHVTFIPIDFNQSGLAEVLSPAGYDPTKKTLFIWEGVTYYIEAHAVDGTLVFIRENSPAGSQVAFDYIFDRVVLGDFSDFGAEEAESAVAEVGEPFTFGLPEGEIGAFLAERGFLLTQHFTPEELHATYLDARFGRIYGFFQNAVATVR